jgi:hypothetical protein
MPLPTSRSSQIDLPGCEQRPGQTLQRRANAPLMPAAPQSPCDVGLFGDQTRQEELWPTLP